MAAVRSSMVMPRDGHRRGVGLDAHRRLACRKTATWLTPGRMLMRSPDLRVGVVVELALR